MSLFGRIPSAVRVGLFAGVLVLCGAQILRGALAPPVTVPVAKDAKKAERDAPSRVGGPDVRMPLGDAGLIGGNGVVEPAQRETRLAAQTTAIVRRILVQEGQRVAAGALLIQMDDGVEQAALKLAEAELAAERAARARTNRGLRVEDRDAVAAEAQAARARAELSEGVRARVEKLGQVGATTRDEVDRARRQAEGDRAALRAAEARLRAAETGSRGEDISAQQARVLAAEAKVAQARAALDRLAIKAPYAGEILQIKIREGELFSFQSTEPLLVMGDTQRLRVRMDVDERDVARVRPGAAAYVMADAFGEERFTGRVAEIGRRFGRKNIRTDDPVERNDTKVLEVVIDLERADKLIVGQRVRSFITGG